MSFLPSFQLDLNVVITGECLKAVGGPGARCRHGNRWQWKSIGDVFL